MDGPIPFLRGRGPLPVDRLKRVGVIDVGSNTVRLVVFDGAARSPAYFFNEKVMCALGEGMADSGRLSRKGRKRALAALRRFRRLTEGMGASVHAVATAAVREAEDGPEFVDQVAAETGIRLEVIPGRDEARLSAQGVLLGWPDARGLVCDIGGASMELAELLGDGVIGRCETSGLGPLRLEALGLGRKALKAHVRGQIEELRRRFPGGYRRIYLVGGSWRAIARIDMERRRYPLKVLHEYEMKPTALRDTLAWIRRTDIEELRELSGVSRARLRLAPLAALVLRELVEAFRPERVAVSSYGLREGLLYEQMPEDLRRRDPLIEAARHMEASAARVPGFGSVLYEFILPLFADRPPEVLRLIRAACHLHDVSWRAHPDYRAEVVFDNATRANLGGLDHRGRVFLGIALLNRYKNARSSSAFARASELLTEERIRLAQAVGKAMRFGAMLSGEVAHALGRLELPAEGRELRLLLPATARDLYGEVVEERFRSLARALGRKARVVIEEAP
ncbi:MAG: Ppx/GppA family phosphatase [Alphaproteobacteria bacterium]|nr:MAG: Ppx/GppA family phosphatase [Alphaproteobacteria bacterium]